MHAISGWADGAGQADLTTARNSRLHDGQKKSPESQKANGSIRNCRSYLGRRGGAGHSVSGPRRAGIHPLVQFRLKGRERVNQANTKEMGADPKASTDEQHLGMSFLGVPNIFGGLTEQSLSRAKESIEKMKMASGAINDALLQAYSANTKGAADYAAKVIEFSGANTSSAFDFFNHLLGMKSPSELLQLSAAQGRKNFEATAAQSRELWELTRKVASETADPIKQSFASVLQKAA